MIIQMQNRIIAILFLGFMVFSCQKENQKRLVENKREMEKRELIFSNIKEGWVFNDTPINETADSVAVSWNEFRQFLDELAQKPKKTIGAFQKKSEAISKKVMLLDNNIPYQYDKPQIKSRISALITKVRMLNLFIHLDHIPDKKVVGLIADINKELISLQRQMDKLNEKSKIPVEEGESEMLRMLDTVRAIPNNSNVSPRSVIPNRSQTITPQNQNIPRVE